MANSVHDPDINTEVVSKEKSGLFSAVGGFISSFLVKKDEFGSSVKNDTSHVSIKFKDGSFFSFVTGFGILKTIGDFCLNVQRNLTINVKGDIQGVFYGDYNIVHNGDVSIQHGNPTAAQKAAAIKLAGISKKIQQAKIEKTEQVAKSREATVACPICKQKQLDQKAYQKAKAAARTFRKYFHRLPIPWDVIQKIIQYVIAPFLGISSVLSLNGGKGCGSPGCVNGQIVDPQHAINAGTQAGIEAYKQNQKDIEDTQKQLDNKGKTIHYFHKDTMIQVGIPGAQNQQPDHAKVGHKVNVTGHADAQAAKAQGFVPDTKGSVENKAYIPPEINEGRFHVNVNEDFSLTTGAPGIDIKSGGKLDMTGTKIDIIAQEGEIVISSGNQTTIAGGNVIIDAKNRSGDEGAIIDGNTHIKGKLCIDGDITVKGRILGDSSIYVPHIHIPGERISVTPCGKEDMHAGMAVHNNMVKKSATILDRIDNSLKAIGRDLGWAVTMFFADLGLAAITKKVEETYATVAMAVPVDNHFMPTGYASFFKDSITQTPIFVYGAIPATTAGYGIIGHIDPTATANIYSYPHTHYSTVDSHQHDQLVVKGQHYDSEFDMRNARPAPSHVPVPPETKGMGSDPGHKSISSCGGGGGGFGSSARVKNAVLARNAGYNIQGLDAFNNSNYVNATANFTPDGNLNPPPKFNMLNCE